MSKWVQDKVPSSIGETISMGGLKLAKFMISDKNKKVEVIKKGLGVKEEPENKKTS